MLWRSLGAGAVLSMSLVSAVHAGPKSGNGVVRFTYVSEAASSVSLVGDWNGWSPNATPLDGEPGGVWVAQVFIDPGVYEYKLLVDGEWLADPDNPELSENGNSVLRVGPNGTVLPPDVRTSNGGDTSGSQRLRWYVRYLGFFTSERERSRHRWDLRTPTHDIDLALETDFGAEANGWFLTNITNLSEADVSGNRATLRFDRGLLTWRPGGWDVRLFDNVGVVQFDDPGKLVGQIGIYADEFGYARRGVLVQRKFLGAPFAFVYADDTEEELVIERDTTNGPVALLPYGASASDRNADALAMRFRAGRADAGVGFSTRSDRGAAPGTLADASKGLLYQTFENWSAWGVDLRYRFGDVRLAAEYLAGRRLADAALAVPVTGGEPLGVDAEFDLDDSRRVVAMLDGGDGSHLLARPWLRYAYQEHDFTQLVTGNPFLMRQHSLEAGLDGHIDRLHVTLRLEQSWFTYPSAATWETQFWFRRHNFWLDEDTARFDRLTLLGADRASFAELELASILWPARKLDGNLRCRWSAPGFDRAPRYLETVLRFRLPLRPGIELRTHSRLASYRRVTTADPEVEAAFGSGPQLVAGTLTSREFADAEYDYRNFGAHFVEIVYALSERSDVSLGFGVDPFAVYEVRNEYMDNGWDQFLFAQGASPAVAFANPVTLARRLEDAERALERERRLTLEARLRF